MVAAITHPLLLRPHHPGFVHNEQSGLKSDEWSPFALSYIALQ